MGENLKSLLVITSFHSCSSTIIILGTLHQNMICHCKGCGNSSCLAHPTVSSAVISGLISKNNETFTKQNRLESQRSPRAVSNLKRGVWWAIEIFFPIKQTQGYL